MATVPGYAFAAGVASAAPLESNTTVEDKIIVVELFAPSEDIINRTRAWVEASGIRSSRISLSANKQWIQFDAKASELEQLLHTTFFAFENRKNSLLTIACDQYHVPENLSAHIDFIKPGVHFVHADIHSNKEQRGDSRKRIVDDRNTRHRAFFERVDAELSGPRKKADVCDKLATPACIFKLYNITDGPSENHPLKKQPENSMGVYETWLILYNPATLEKYLKLYTDIPPKQKVEYLRIDGAPPARYRNLSGGEANLDVQTLYPFVYPDKAVIYQVDDIAYERYPAPGMFNTFLDAIDGSYCNFTAFGITGNSPVDPKYPHPVKHGYKGELQCGVYKPTKVISISYDPPETYYPSAYQRRQCLEWMKLGLQGTTVVLSSGDSGINSQSFNCFGPDNHIFVPENLSSCPYTTSVGGTQIPRGGKPIPGVETASVITSSGGGFSNVMTRPKYQDAAVEYYFKHHEPPYDYYYNTNHNNRPKHKSGYYNRVGRGYPDVSAIADKWAVYLTGKAFGGPEGDTFTAYGTSISAPLFGSLLTRINNHRLAAGKSTVGFVNPALYANPHMFNDVTVGVNEPRLKEGCGTHGFSCAPGWDPVTGLGTPNYGKMLEFFMALP